MSFSPDKLRLSSPIRSQQKIYKEGDAIDQEYLYHRLSAILFTLQAQKEDFQQKYNNEKKSLLETVQSNQKRLQDLQQTNLKLQQQNRQLRFNYNQRGSVVDYLKKKITVIQKKFDSQKQQMLSVIKYLQNKNSQLNETIFQLKKKQLEINQNIIDIQQKYYQLQYEYNKKNTFENNSYLMNSSALNHPIYQNDHMENLKNNAMINPIITQRRSFCGHKKNPSCLTPQYHQKKYKYKNNKDKNKLNIPLPFSSRQINNFQVNYFSLEDSNNQSLTQSSIKEKTVKYQNTINRAKSSDQFDFCNYDEQQFNNQNRKSSLGIKNPNRFVQTQRLNGQQKIWINNYGHINLNQYPSIDLGHQFPKSKLKKQNFIQQGKPKLSLPYNARYPTQQNTQRRKINQV